MFSGSVIDTLETLSSGSVTVADCIWVHIAIALAFLTLLRWPELSSGVTEVTISAHLAFWPCKEE